MTTRPPRSTDTPPQHRHNADHSAPEVAPRSPVLEKEGGGGVKITTRQFDPKTGSKNKLLHEPEEESGGEEK